MKKFLISILICFAFISANTQTFTNVTTFAGTGNPALVNGPLATCQFDAPYAICCDYATGDLYVADVWNHCIRKISGGVVTTIAGNGTQGDVNGQGPNARFYVPGGVAFFNGEVYVSDGGNNKIKKIDALGNVTTIAGTGNVGYLDGPAATARFYNPVGLRVRPNGDIYVADYLNDCIRKISGGQVTTVAGIGNVPGDVLGSVTVARFDRPSDIVFDAAGNIYVADQLNNKVKIITTAGMVNLVAGSGSASSNNGTGSGASFNQPAYCDLDLGGNIILTECFGHKIRRVTPAGVATTIAGSVTMGYIDGPVATARFNTPYGICIDNSGNIYIGDRGNDVIRTLINVNTVSATITSSNITCNGSNNGTATVNSFGGTSPYTYAWSPSGGTNASANNLSPGTYTCIITDALGATSQQTVAITQPSPLPTAFTSNATNGFLLLAGSGGQICFTGPAGVSSWSWNLNGTATSTQQSPCVSISTTDIGPYCADLTVTNSFGCTATDSLCVEITNLYYSIPNVFTPDNDLVNDGFVITNVGMKTLRCNIYNRWGEMIYQWDGTDGYWNGKSKNGNDAVDGVYYYTVFMVDFQDKIYNEQGFVQLVRGK